MARVSECLDDDLNTPLAVAELFEALSAANTLADGGQVDDAEELANAIAVLFGALGLRLEGDVSEVDDAAAALVAARDQARRDRQWADADRLRDELVALGWTVEDGPTGTIIRR